MRNSQECSSVSAGSVGRSRAKPDPRRPVLISTTKSHDDFIPRGYKMESSAGTFADDRVLSRPRPRRRHSLTPCHTCFFLARLFSSHFEAAFHRHFRDGY